MRNLFIQISGKEHHFNEQLSFVVVVSVVVVFVVVDDVVVVVWIEQLVN